MQDNAIINKTMDRNDLSTEQAKIIINELNQLIQSLKQKNLKISSWYGAFDLSGDENTFEYINRGYGYEPLETAIDDKNFPWFLYWEITWVYSHAKILKSQKVLDLGGSSSLFSYYLASKGVDVTTVDINNTLVENANYVAEKMGWKLKNFAMDMRELAFDYEFDHITSICVYEHIPMFDRVKINNNIKKLLKKEGGRFSITFDYRNPSRFSKISSPEDIQSQFIIPSGLTLRGNREFFDCGKNYLLQPFHSPHAPLKRKIGSIIKGHFGVFEIFKKVENNEYTFGSLFLEKK